MSRSKTKRPDKRHLARARETQAAQTKAEAKKLTLSGYRRRRILGWGLVALAVVVGGQHLISHVSDYALISPGLDDIVAGYPLAAVLGVAGAILLSKT